MSEATPPADDAVSPVAPSKADHYHQVVPAGVAAKVTRWLAKAAQVASAALTYAHEHRKALVVAVPAVVAWVQAQGITVPAVFLTALTLIVGAVPNRPKAGQ